MPPVLRGRQFNGFIRGNFRRVEQVEIGASKASSSLSATPAQGSGEDNGQYPAPPVQYGQWPAGLNGG